MNCNEIWVLAEIRRGRLTRATRQLIAAARNLAKDQGLGVAAVLLGGSESQADELASYAELVIRAGDPSLDPYEATRHQAALSHILDARGRPAAILAGSSACGLEMMPRLAARHCTGYASSCVALWWEGSQLAVRRPIYGGRAYEEVTIAERPALLTVRPGAFPIPGDLATPGRVENVSIALPDSLGLRVSDCRASQSDRPYLTDAARVIAGGRGMGKPDGFRLIEELATELKAAVGASRSVVDAGWRPHEEQVGKSGQTISPELYIACGISGAVHHVLGMNTAKVVVAINTDPEAPIFESADFGIVGNALEILPALTQAMRERA